MNKGRDRDMPGRDDESRTSSSSPPRVIAVTDDRIDSRALFGTSRQITIEHGADAYILRITAQNKLILTK